MKDRTLVRSVFFSIALALALIASAAWGPGRTASPALAHSGYERSEPEDGAVLTEAPARVDIYFGQEMARSGGLPSMVVVNDFGDQVDLGATLDDDDRKHMYAELAPALPGGRYTVIWHTLSDEDAEEAQGAFHFYVGEDPAGRTASPVSPTAIGSPSPRPTAAPSPVAAGGDNDGDVSVGLLVLAIAAGGAIGGSAGYAAGRRFGR